MISFFRGFDKDAGIAKTIGNITGFRQRRIGSKVMDNARRKGDIGKYSIIYNYDPTGIPMGITYSTKMDRIRKAAKDIEVGKKKQAITAGVAGTALAATAGTLAYNNMKKNKE